MNYKLIRAHEKKAKAEQKAAKSSPEPDRPRTLQDIEQYYRDKRDRAELIAERNLIRARENERFKLADDIATSMAITVAFAPFNAPEKVEEYERRLQRAKAERLIALQELGLTEADITPQYECKLCNDTGQLSDGSWCGCYPRGKPLDSENVGAGEQNN